MKRPTRTPPAVMIDHRLKVLDIIIKNPDITSDEIAYRLELPNREVGVAIRSLIYCKQIERTSTSNYRRRYRAVVPIEAVQ